MVQITDVKLNSIMFENTFDEMTILYYNTRIGGGLLTPTVESFHLFGGGTSIPPLKYLPTSTITINEVESPAWDTVKNITTPEELQAVRNANSTIHHSPNAVSLPPLIKALISLEFPAAANVFMATILVTEDFYKDKLATVQGSTGSLQKLLTYIRDTHYKNIGTVEKIPKVSKAILDKTAALHKDKIFTSPPANKITISRIFHQSIHGYGSNERPFETTSFKFHHGIIRYLFVHRPFETTSFRFHHAQADTSLSTKKKIETRLNARVRTLILTGSAKDSSSTLKEPTNTARELFRTEKSIGNKKLTLTEIK